MPASALPAAFVTGFGLGFVVAAQVGPIWLLCVRSVLRGRLLTGLAIGAGAAIIDLTYAALSGAVALVRRRVGPRGLRLADSLSGLGIMGFGGLLGWRAARHS